MDYTTLGRTGLRISRLALGTAEFGLPGYGIRPPGDGDTPPDEAIATICAAHENGVNFFDTARGYGGSENILGRALAGRDCVIATKIGAPPADMTTARWVEESLAASLKDLARPVLDIVQVHNATPELLQGTDLLDCLERARQAGRFRFIGASVYGETAALAAIRCGRIDVLQIAFNLLDQRMRQRVLPEAQVAGVGIVVRSALLKGALTARAQWLPPRLAELAKASDRARRTLGDSWESLPSTALRFCLSSPGIQAVLIGVQNRHELQQALASASAGALDRELLRKTAELGLQDERLLNPSYWQMS